MNGKAIALCFNIKHSQKKLLELLSKYLKELNKEISKLGNDIPHFSVRYFHPVSIC